MSNFPPTYPSSAPGSDGRDARWPGWIGGFSVGLAALGMLGLCCGVGGLLSGSVFSKMSGMEFPPPPRLIVVMTVAGGAVALVLAAMELSGGISTLRRKPSGPRMLLRYAVLSLLYAAVTVPLNYLTIRPGAEWAADIMHAQLDFAEKNGAKVTAESRAEAEAAREPTAFGYISPFVGSAIGIVFPLVLLTFLRRPDVRAQWESWEA